MLGNVGVSVAEIRRDIIDAARIMKVNWFILYVQCNIEIYLSVDHCQMNQLWLS